MADDDARVTLTVGPGETYRTINAAVGAAQAGARILVRAGSYRESIFIIDDLEIVGEPGAELTGKPWAIGVEGATVRLEQLAIRAGSAGLGGFLDRLKGDPELPTVSASSGTLELVECDVTGGKSAAIGVLGGATRLRRCRIHDGPSVGLQVHGIEDQSEVQLEDTEIADFAGGCIVVAGSSAKASLTGGRLSGGAEPGVAVLDGARAEIAGADIGGVKGVGVYVSGAGTTAAITGCRIHDCDDDGVTITDHATATVEDCELWGNVDEIAVFGEEATATVSGCTLRDGRAPGIHLAEGGSASISRTAVIRCARAGVMAEGPATTIELRDSVIRESDGYGLGAGGGVRGTIEGNEIVENLFSGITLNGDVSGMMVTNNVIRANGGLSAGVVQDGARPTLRGNRIAAVVPWRAIETKLPSTADDNIEPPDLTPRAAVPGPRPAVGARLGLGVMPMALAFDGAGSLWVANLDPAMACRIDEASARVDRIVALRHPDIADAELGALSLAVAGDRLYVACMALRPPEESLPGLIAEIDPVTGTVKDWIRLQRGMPVSLCHADGVLWAALTGANAVARIELSGARMSREVATIHEPAAIVAGHGGIWVAGERPSLQRLDPASGRVVRTVDLDPVAGLAVTPDAIVAAVPKRGRPDAAALAGEPSSRLVEIDPGADRVRRKLPIAIARAVGHGPAGLWAAPSDAVVQIDAAFAGFAQTVEVGTIANAIAVGRDHVWVLYPYSVGFLSTESAPGTLVRVDLA